MADSTKEVQLTDYAPPPWVYQQPANLVIEQIDKMSDRATTALNLAYTTIDALGQLELGSEDTAPPDIAFPDVPGATIERPDKPSIAALGTIDAFVDQDFTEFQNLYDQLDAITADLPEPGDFQSSIGAIVIPAPPEQINMGGVPDHPELVDPTIPDAPVFNVPTLDGLLELNLPVFVMPEFPDFEDADVEFDGADVNPVLAWAEPAYTPTVLTEIAARIKLCLAGGTGMTPEIEAALFSRARGRVDTTALKRTQEAFDTWAGRGFTMPPGMLVEQVNAAQQENQLTVNELASDILAKSAEWEQTNLREAVQQGIALETQLIGQFENYAKRVFDAQKIRVESEIALFQAHVTLFNARQAARQVLVDVFKAKIQAAMSKIDAYKAQVDAELAKAQVNESLVRAYAARIEALKSIVAIFTARVEAVKVQSDMQKNRVDMYKADVDAYSARIGADKLRFDAYESQVKGEAAKAGIIESEARAFAATVEAQTSNGNVKIAAIRGKIDAVGAAVQKFNALTTAERDRIGSQATAIQAKAQAFSADASRYAAELGANVEEARLAITISESRLRNNLAYYETRVREYDQSMNRLIERGRVIVSALAAGGNMAAQLASGAMSAMHVQASLSGSGSASTGWSNSYSYSENHNFEDESTSHK